MRTQINLSTHLYKILRYLAPFLGGLAMAAGTIGILFVLSAGPTQAAPAPAPFSTQTEALTQALKALVTRYQNDDGGYKSFSNGANSAPSDADGTTDAILAIAAAGSNPNIPYPGQSNHPVGWLQTHPISLATYAAGRSGSAAKVVMALVAANQDPTNFEGYNFVISLTNQLDSSGQFQGNFDTYGHSLSMLALKAASATIPVTATQWLTSQQTITGNFDDPDQTGTAIMALLAAGVPTDDISIISATNYLSDTQLTNGGWRPSWDTVNSANPNSTALVYQALLALAENAGPGSRWDKGSGNTPLAALLEMQNSTGAFLFFGFDNYYSTAQAIPALANAVYPIQPEPLSQTVSPGGGSKTITYNDPGGQTIQVVIPDNAVSQPTELRLSPVTPLPTTTVPVTPTTATFRFAGQLFSLKAYQSGAEQPSFNFDNPITITLKYSGSSLGVKENSLQLYYWDGSQWRTDGITIISRNPAGDELVVTITHLTNFAMFGAAFDLYLPVIHKSN